MEMEDRNMLSRLSAGIIQNPESHIYPMTAKDRKTGKWLGCIIFDMKKPSGAISPWALVESNPVYDSSEEAHKGMEELIEEVKKLDISAD